jgi:hypothetical protein
VKAQSFLKVGFCVTLGLALSISACGDEAKPKQDAGKVGVDSGPLGGSDGAVGGSTGLDVATVGGTGGGGTGGTSTKPMDADTGPVTLTSFDTELDGFAYNTGWDGGSNGTNLAWDKYTGTRATMSLDSGVGNPAPSMKYVVAFTDYTQFVDGLMPFNEQDWTGATITFDVMIPAPMPAILKQNGGIDFQMRDALGGAAYMWQSYSGVGDIDDGKWHTLSFKVPTAANNFDRSRVVGITIQVGSGSRPKPPEPTPEVDSGEPVSIDGGTSDIDGGVDGGSVVSIDAGPDAAVLPVMGTVTFYFDNIVVH